MINNYPSERKSPGKKNCPYCGATKCARGLYSHIRLQHPEFVPRKNKGIIESKGPDRTSVKETQDVTWSVPEEIRQKMGKIPYAFYEKYGPPEHKINWKTVTMPASDIEHFKQVIYNYIATHDI